MGPSGPELRHWLLTASSTSSRCVVGVRGTVGRGANGIAHPMADRFESSAGTPAMSDDTELPTPVCRHAAWSNDRSLDIHGARIVVAGARPAAVAKVQAILRAAGYVSVVTAGDLALVPGLHRSHAFQLMILGLQPEPEPAWKVLETVRHQDGASYPPVLLLGARAPSKIEGLARGARDALLQPFDADELRERVRSLLEMRLMYEDAIHQAEELAPLAMLDPLTGLANRRLFADRVHTAMATARRNRRTVAIVYLDLDGFKDINDRHGHYVGDAVLQAVAMRLCAVVRAEDTVSRVGGDEFMVLLWDVASNEGAATVVLKMIAEVSRPYLVDGLQVALTTSAGVGLYPDHGDDPYALIKSADAALYDAKRAGKNDFRFSDFSPML